MSRVEDFSTFFRTELLPQLEPLEAERKQVVARMQRAGAVALVGVIVLAFALARLAPGRNLWVLAILPGAFGLAIYVGLQYARYRAGFKERVIGPIVRFFDPSLQYKPKEFIPQHVFQGSNMFHAYPDRYTGEDLVVGQIGHTAIQFSEVHAEVERETRDSKGERKVEYDTIFKGVLFVADFNKHFQGLTVVTPDAGSVLGGLGRMGQNLMFSGRGKLTKLDDPEFEKCYAVYATDEIEARYLLSPSLMARIMAFRKRTDCPVSLSFVHGHLHVAITHRKNLFEPRLRKTLLDEQMAQDFLQDLMLVVGIVEDLDLNTRIWSKQPMA